MKSVLKKKGKKRSEVCDRKLRPTSIRRHQCKHVTIGKTILNNNCEYNLIKENAVDTIPLSDSIDMVSIIPFPTPFRIILAKKFHSVFNYKM